MKCKFFSLFFLFFLPFPGLSAEEEYYFKHLTTANGLSQNTVLSILQDSIGFMWFGTKDGLNRYDGNSFKIYKYDEPDTTCIGNNTVWSLLQVPGGDIWAGTEKGIFIYHPQSDSFTAFDARTESGECVEDVVLDMQTDAAGNIWIAASNLFRYSPHTGQLELILSLDQDPSASIMSRIWSVYIDRDEQVWISIYHGGVKRYNPIENNIRSYTKDTLGEDFSSALISKTVNLTNDYLLIGAFNENLRLLNKTTGKTAPLYITPNNNEKLFVRDMALFSDGNCWIGTESGVYIYDIENKTSTHLTHNRNDRYSLSDNAIYSLYEDREGGIWVGTYFGGVNYFPRPYNHFKKHYPIENQNSISGERVSGICEDLEGNIWIGTEDAGLHKLNVKTNRFELFAPGCIPEGYTNTINYHNVHDVLVDDSLLWVGTYSHGINVLNMKTRTWKYYRKGDTPGTLNNNDIFALFKDTSGRIWIGTSTGAFLFDRDTERFIMQEHIGMRFISDIIEDADGQIWFATSDHGAYCYNPRTQKCIQYNYDVRDTTSICYHRITCMHLDTQKRLWFGSESNGICMFDKVKGNFVRYGMKDGFTNNTIYEIQDDTDGNLWLSSNAGLMRFNPGTKTVRTFTQDNGLPGNQFNYKSGYRDRNGKMYFGSTNGLVTFYPTDFRSNTCAPPVAITNIELSGKRKKQRQQAYMYNAILPPPIPTYFSKPQLIESRHQICSFELRRSRNESLCLPDGRIGNCLELHPNCP